MEVLAMSVWTRISRLTINDRVTHRVPHEDQELLTILEHLSSSPVFDCVYVLPVFFFLVFVRDDYCLSLSYFWPRVCLPVLKFNFLVYSAFHNIIFKINVGFWKLLVKRIMKSHQAIAIQWKEIDTNLKGDIHFRVGASQSNEVTDTEKHIQSKFGKFTWFCFYLFVGAQLFFAYISFYLLNIHYIYDQETVHSKQNSYTVRYTSCNPFLSNFATIKTIIKFTSCLNLFKFIFKQ